MLPAISAPPTPNPNPNSLSLSCSQATRNGSNLGSGVYVAPYPQKALQYAHVGVGNTQMLFVVVVNLPLEPHDPSAGKPNFDNQTASYGNVFNQEIVIRDAKDVYLLGMITLDASA